MGRLLNIIGGAYIVGSILLGIYVGNRVYNNKPFFSGAQESKLVESIASNEANLNKEKRSLGWAIGAGCLTPFILMLPIMLPSIIAEGIERRREERKKEVCYKKTSSDDDPYAWYRDD